jgi:outer membrane protein
MTRKSARLFLILLCIAFFTSLLSGFASAEDHQVAFIDSQRVVDESKAGKEALQKLEEFKKKNEVELSNKAKEIADLEEELRKKKFALSQEAMDNLEESIRRKNIDLKRFKEDKEMELKDLYFKHLNEIKERIIQIVQQIGHEKAYTVIFNKDESIIFANPAYDLTSQVIEIYDREVSTGSKGGK